MSALRYASGEEPRVGDRVREGDGPLVVVDIVRGHEVWGMNDKGERSVRDTQKVVLVHRGGPESHGERTADNCASDGIDCTGGPRSRAEPEAPMPSGGDTNEGRGWCHAPLALARHRATDYLSTDALCGATGAAWSRFLQGADRCVTCEYIHAEEQKADPRAVGHAWLPLSCGSEACGRCGASLSRTRDATYYRTPEGQTVEVREGDLFPPCPGKGVEPEPVGPEHSVDVAAKAHVWLNSAQQVRSGCVCSCGARTGEWVYIDRPDRTECYLEYYDAAGARVLLLEGDEIPPCLGGQRLTPPFVAGQMVRHATQPWQARVEAAWWTGGEWQMRLDWAPSPASPLAWACSAFELAAEMVTVQIQIPEPVPERNPYHRENMSPNAYLRMEATHLANWRWLRDTTPRPAVAVAREDYDYLCKPAPGDVAPVVVRRETTEAPR